MAPVLSSIFPPSAKRVNESVGARMKLSKNVFDSPAGAALAGITVVEHGKGVAASYAGRILALMGATVIKVERPQEGDALRYEAPILPATPNVGALFTYLNVDKGSVTLDPSSARGRELLGELLDQAAIFIDDTYPKTRSEWGIGFEDLCPTRPKLIYVSVLPFGAVGPHSEYRAHELNVLHAGGEGYLMPNGLALEMFPDRPPVKFYGHFAELIGGTSAVCATIAALLVQADVGGQFVDVSVQDANVANSCFAIQRLGDGVLENRYLRSFKYGGVMKCSDGYIQILVLEHHQWKGLVKLIGEPAWALQPEFDDELERGRRGAEINKHLREWAMTQKVDDLVQKGQALGVPLAKYADLADVLESEQSHARGMFSTIEMAEAGCFPILTAPFQSKAQTAGVMRYPTMPGADNLRVWCEWLGHSRSELERWTSDRVI